MPLILALLFFPLLVAAAPAPVTVLTIDDAITPATADYFVRGLKRATDNGSSLVVLTMDTPGGLDSSMREIVKAILASPIPVAAFVAPGGARAASAGTYILYAAHIAAMAPGTNLGAATPVAIGLGGPSSEPASPPRPDGKQPKGDDDKSSGHAKSAMTEKQIHDAAAYIRGLAQLRGRNAEWAEKAVREAVSLSADEALAQHVVDVVAPDVTALLARIQGRHVSVHNRDVALDVAGAEAIRVDPDWRTHLLSVIASPSLALVLMMLGVYGLIFEFMSPGYILPGVVGGISLLLGLFALQMLPFNFAGLALIALGIAFLVAEAFVPTSGALGVGGLLAFVIGAIILIDTDVAGYAIPLPLVLGIAALSALFLVAVVRFALKARRRTVVSGREALVGSRGEVLSDSGREGWARVHGETWQVRSTAPLAKGQSIRVTGIHGLVLDVEPDAVSTTGGAP